MTIELLDEVVNYSPDHVVFVKGKMDADNVVKWTEKYEKCLNEKTLLSNAQLPTESGQLSQV